MSLQPMLKIATNSIEARRPEGPLLAQPGAAGQGALDIEAVRGSGIKHETILAYCQREQLTFTRGRPDVKNDQWYVEEKNGAVVRRFVGSQRMEGEGTYHQLRELYRALRLYVNGFQPSMKLHA